MANIESNGSKERMDERLERMHKIEERMGVMERNCDNCKYRDVYYMASPCDECNFEYQRQPQKGFQNWESDAMTNADHIRAMSDEEMAEFWGIQKAFCPPEKTVLSCLDEDMKIVLKYPDGCINCWLDWLKGEVKDDH